jgi:hypothetical protein
MCAHQNWGRHWVERPNFILFGSNVPMLYCLGRTPQCYIVWVWVERPNTILFEEICIYYMHFVCWNAYILWTMLIIESMLYVFWGELCLERSTQCVCVGVKWSTICAQCPNIIGLGC